MDILKDGIILHSTKKMDIDVTCNLPARPRIDVDERLPSFLRSSLSKARFQNWQFSKYVVVVEGLKTKL